MTRRNSAIAYLISGFQSVVLIMSLFVVHSSLAQTQGIAETNHTTLSADDAIVLSVKNALANEKDGVIRFEMSLSHASTLPVRFRVATAGNTATMGEDFYGTSEAVEFLPGETLKYFEIELLNSSQPELTEVFNLIVTNIENAQRGDFGTPNGVIIDASVDDDTAVMMISNATALETDDYIRFKIELIRGSTQPASLMMSANEDVTAIRGVDYYGRYEMITFQPGETVKYFEVDINYNPDPAPIKFFRAFVFNFVNAVRVEASNYRSGTILGQTVAEASVDVVSASVREGDVIDVDVVLDRAVDQPSSVLLATASMTATQGQDYYGVFTKIAFAPGEKRQSVQVLTLRDADPEVTENFSVRLFAPEGDIVVSTSGAQQLVEIVDNDSPIDQPQLTITGNDCIEGQFCTLTVSLSPVSDTQTTVSVSTRAQTAIQGEDYYGVYQVLTLNPGTSQIQVPVQTLDDAIQSDAPTFQGRLFAAEGATISKRFTAPIRILDDD